MKAEIFAFQGEIVRDDNLNFFDESAIIVAFIGDFSQSLFDKVLSESENFHESESSSKVVVSAKFFCSVEQQ